ncbi:MAG: ABC transporter permease [Candidatus Binatia bacterium]
MKRSGRLARFGSNVVAVAYKETSVMRHDQAFLSMVFLQPIMMLLLMGFVLSNKPANVPWAVLDRSDTALSRRLLQDLEATGIFLEPQRVQDYEEGRARLHSQEALALLVFPRDLRRQLLRGRPEVQLLLDGSDPLSSARVAAYVSQVAAALDVGVSPAPHLRQPGTPVLRPGGIDVRQRFWFNPTLQDRRFFLAALAGMLLTNLCLSATSLGLVGERESGTYEQMLSLPTTSLEIVLGKLLPYVAISYGVLGIAILLPGLLFGIWPAGSPLALVLVTLPFVLASLAIGVFVSTLAHTSAQAVFITVFFIMPSFVLSGVLLPYQLMPHGVREVGAVLPLRWYQIALRRIIERGGGLLDVAVPAIALFAIFGALLALVRWRMKPRLG